MKTFQRLRDSVHQRKSVLRTARLQQASIRRGDHLEKHLHRGQLTPLTRRSKRRVSMHLESHFFEQSERHRLYMQGLHKIKNLHRLRQRDKYVSILFELFQ